MFRLRSLLRRRGVHKNPSAAFLKFIFVTHERLYAELGEEVVV